MSTTPDGGTAPHDAGAGGTRDAAAAGRVEAIVMARPPEYGGSYGDSDGRGPWGGRWSRRKRLGTPGSSCPDSRRRRTRDRNSRWRARVTAT